MENLVGGGLYISPDQDASTKPGEGVCPVQNRTEPNYFWFEKFGGKNVEKNLEEIKWFRKISEIFKNVRKLVTDY